MHRYCALVAIPGQYGSGMDSIQYLYFKSRFLFLIVAFASSKPIYSKPNKNNSYRCLQVQATLKSQITFLLNLANCKLK